MFARFVSYLHSHTRARVLGLRTRGAPTCGGTSIHAEVTESFAFSETLDLLAGKNWVGFDEDVNSNKCHFPKTALRNPLDCYSKFSYGYFYIVKRNWSLTTGAIPQNWLIWPILTAQQVWKAHKLTNFEYIIPLGSSLKGCEPLTWLVPYKGLCFLNWYIYIYFINIVVSHRQASANMNVKDIF